MYFTITPCRLLDTRGGSQMTNGVPLTVQATGQCGIPAGASAIAFNPVAINPSGDGFFQFYPGSTPPVTSAINFKAGKIRASNAIVDLTAAGAFTARAIVAGSGASDLVIDVFGYFFIGPQANSDTYSTAKNVTLLVPAPGVLANDTGNQNTAQPFNGASTHGTVVLLADGSFTYTPTSGYFGPDSFPYTVQNPAGNSNSTVFINVTEPPTITSANSASFPPSVFTTFTVTTTGFPTGPSMVITQTGALPPGVTFVDNHDGTATISGIASGSGSFPIVITAHNGIAPDATQNFTIQLCPVITVTNPGTTTGTVNTAFSQTFTQTGASGTATFTTSSTLPAGLTLATNGTLSGTPTQSGSFPIVVTVTDSQGCTGTSPTYTLVIGCQTITVTNPGVTTGTANAFFSQTFLAGNTVGAVTFTLASGALPAGMNLAANGTLSGTPTQTGSFPITVTATDANGCAGTGATYTLVINCQTITVTNPATTTGTVNSPFSQTFTQSNAIGASTFTTASTLPAGMSLATNGLLSGTPTQPGTFPIVVTVTDANGCTGTGATYNLTIGCQVITVTNPATTTGTVGTAFNQIFTQTGAVGVATFTTASTLPTGMSLATNGTLSGTPTQSGTFPIVVTVTDGNGCTGTSSTYNLVISCQTMTLSPTALPPATSGVLYPSVTFTQTGGIGAVAFSQTGTLPTGMGFSVDTLSGTPTQTGSFPIHVTATDSNGCTAARDYLLVVACPGTGITISPSSLPTVTANTAFPSTQFTGSGGAGPYTFAEAGALPSGMSFVVDTLSGTPTQVGTFPITISATDSNGCAGSQDYVITVTCNGVAITVNPPALSGATVGTPYAPVTFTGSGGVAPYTFSEAGALPAGMSFSVDTLSGTPTQAGTFPIAVTATDSNGCVGATNYSLVVVCQTITVNNPGVTTGTVDAAFSQTFTQTGGNGAVTFTTTSTLPSGLSLSSAGVLSGSPGQPGSFPIVVQVKDANGCTGTGATYTLVIACQTITVTNPGVTTATVDTAFTRNFTQTGVGTHTPATFSLASGTLPSGVNLSSAGVLSGTPGQPGSFPITVTVTDANGCTGTSSTYTLVVACQTITVTNPGVTTATFNSFFTRSFTQSGVGTHTPATFTTASTLPTGVTLSSAGVLSGTPTVTGTYPIVVTVTDANGCTGTGATYTLAVAPVATADAYGGLIDNTQFVVTGGATGSPGTPFVGTNGAVTFRLTNNDLPSGGVTITTGTFASAGGGSVTIAADGTFIYTPKANPTLAATTSDSFNYTISSNTGGTATAVSATGTASLTLANRVWYVKNDAGAGIGQSQSPFNTLAGAAGASTASDIIYVYFGNGTTSNQNAGITLKNNQVLTGEGLALIVGGVTLRGAGSSPQITNGGGNVVTLANSNTIQGLTLTGASNALVFGGSGVTGTTNLNTVPMTPSGTANGVSLTSQAAGHTFNYNSGSIVSSSSGAAVLMSGASGAGPATFAINISSSSGMPISIANRNAGTVSFSGTVGSTGQGISLSSNTGSTINFTNTITLSTGANTGFSATGGGTVSASNAGSTIATTTGTALNVANTTIGASHLVFLSVSAGTAASGPTNGILLNTTGATGGLHVLGSGAQPSGGTIQRTTGAAIALTGTTGASFNAMSIQNTSGSGVDGTGVTDFTFTNGVVNAAGNSGFESALAFNGNGSQFGNNIAGTLTVTGNTFTSPFYSGLDVQSDNGTVSNANVSNNTITNPGFAGINLVGTGNASTSFNVTTATINQNNISGTGGVGIQVSIGNSNTTGPGATAGVPGTGNIISITNNSVYTIAGSGTQAITVANSGGNSGSRTKTNFDISCNGKNTGGCTAPTANPLGSSSLGTVILIGNNGFATMTGTVNNNVITAVHTPNLGGGNGIAGGNGVAGGGNAWTPDLTLSVTNNVISGTDGNGILLVGRGTSGVFKLKLQNNNVGTPVNAGGSARQGIRVDAGNAASADDSVCLHILGNTSAGSNGAAGIGVRKQGAVSTTNDFGVQTVPQNPPSNTDIQNYINSQNPGSTGTDIINGSSFVQCASAP